FPVMPQKHIAHLRQNYVPYASTVVQRKIYFWPGTELDFIISMIYRTKMDDNTLHINKSDDPWKSLPPSILRVPSGKCMIDCPKAHWRSLLKINWSCHRLRPTTIRIFCWPSVLNSGNMYWIRPLVSLLYLP